MKPLPNIEEREINLIEIYKELKKQHKILYKTILYSFIIGLIISFSIPKEYTVTVTLSPESGNSTGTTLMGMAAMLGLGDLSSTNTQDALNVSLFPDIMASTPFALELYGMQVRPEKSDTTLALHRFMEEQSRSWFGYLFALPGMAVGGVMSLFGDMEKMAAREIPDPFHLTREEEKSLMDIKEMMSAEADKTTGITTISITLQDPVVAAVVADSVVHKLQAYITAYRTKKATEDFNYQEKLYEKSKEEYYRIQREYAAFQDRNQLVTLNAAKVEGERMETQLKLASQIYQQAATQLELLRAKIQEDKPVFAVVEPATVPLKPSAPRKVLILIGFMFLAFVGSAAWILFGKDLWTDIKNELKNQQ